jgi:hypothetical protein
MTHTSREPFLETRGVDDRQWPMMNHRNRGDLWLSDLRGRRRSFRLCRSRNLSWSPDTTTRWATGSYLGHPQDIATWREWRLWTLQKNIIRSPGGPSILDASQQEELVTRIENGWRARQPATPRQVETYLSDQWAIVIARNALGRLLHGIPQGQ